MAVRGRQRQVADGADVVFTDTPLITTSMGRCNVYRDPSGISERLRLKTGDKIGTLIHRKLRTQYAENHCLQNKNDQQATKRLTDTAGSEV